MPQILVAESLSRRSQPAPAQAAPMNRPQAEYSADSTIQNEEGTIEQGLCVRRPKSARKYSQVPEMERFRSSGTTSKSCGCLCHRDICTWNIRWEALPRGREPTRRNGRMKTRRWEKKH